MFDRRVRKSDLPAISALAGRRCPGDFLDCYAVPCTMAPREAAEILAAFPPWASALLALRKILTAPFGLKNDVEGDGARISFFPIERETAREVILGFDDKHLDFRVAVLSHEGAIHAATWVAPHHLGGRAYLALILPFHVAIMRDGLARVARAAAAPPPP